MKRVSIGKNVGVWVDQAQLDLFNHIRHCGTVDEKNIDQTHKNILKKLVDKSLVVRSKKELHVVYSARRGINLQQS